jgi:hypothetical protein
MSETTTFSPNLQGRGSAQVGTRSGPAQRSTDAAVGRLQGRGAGGSRGCLRLAAARGTYVSGRRAAATQPSCKHALGPVHEPPGPWPWGQRSSGGLGPPALMGACGWLQLCVCGLPSLLPSPAPPDKVLDELDLGLAHLVEVGRAPAQVALVDLRGHPPRVDVFLDQVLEKVLIHGAHHVLADFVLRGALKGAGGGGAGRAAARRPLGGLTAGALEQAARTGSGGGGCMLLCCTVLHPASGLCFWQAAGPLPHLLHLVDPAARKVDVVVVGPGDDEVAVHCDRCSPRPAQRRACWCRVMVVSRGLGRSRTWPEQEMHGRRLTRSAHTSADRSAQ